MNAIDHLRAVRQASAVDIAKAIDLPLEHAYAQLVAAEADELAFVEFKHIGTRTVCWWSVQPAEYGQDGRLVA